MRLLIPVIVLMTLFISCKDGKNERSMDADDVNAFLLTDTSWGKILPGSSYRDLEQIFGKGSLSNEKICGPECVDSLDVTIIRKGTSEETIVYWHINEYQEKIASLQTYADSSPYHTKEGLRIGSTLSELLKINKQHINFAGFGWDYGGYIHTYNGGRLDNSPIQFRLELESEGDNALLGDTEIHSEMPEVKERLEKIRIAQIYLVFDE